MERKGSVLRRSLVALAVAIGVVAAFYFLFFIAGYVTGLSVEAQTSSSLYSPARNS
ncbi:hypothetical protein HNR23_004074 [Nocardiopsis mwathae]|uniref:Uncharacterized protein n=1 Tax=Nocardiopsis mwathae TaxID=1472723 RepID=A0A7W9YL57_9ACTN|nr:hypothetical protein [Nocardiopsis mwathae]